MLQRQVSSSGCASLAPSTTELLGILCRLKNTVMIAPLSLATELCCSDLPKNKARALLLIQTSSPVQVMALAAAPTSPPPTSLTQWNERGPGPKFGLGECRSLSCALIQGWQTKVCSRFKCNHEARRAEPSSIRWCIFSRLRYLSSASLTASRGGGVGGAGGGGAA